MLTIHRYQYTRQINQSTFFVEVTDNQAIISISKAKHISHKGTIYDIEKVYRLPMKRSYFKSMVIKAVPNQELNTLIF